MRFIVGVDSRTKLAADLERRLRSTYYLSEFQVIGVSCGFHCRTTRNIASQVDCILEGLLAFPARYFVGISSGRVVKNTPCGRVPFPVTVMTAIDPDGVVHADCIQEIGYHLPWSIRKSSTTGTSDLIDNICKELVWLAGTRPEPIHLSSNTF